MGFYKRAQEIDEFPPGTSGSTILAGAKVAQELGHLAEFRWAFEPMDVLTTLSVNGPVVIGVDWYMDMAKTDPDGYIRPTGKVRGPHCVCLRGVVKDDSDVEYGWTAIGRNSWGSDWGNGGDFKLTGTDLAKLMPNGDVCVPVIRGTPAYEMAFNC